MLGCGSDNVQATTLVRWQLCVCVLAASAFTWRCTVDAAPLLKACLKFQLESRLDIRAVWWFGINAFLSVLSYTLAYRCLLSSPFCLELTFLFFKSPQEILWDAWDRNIQSLKKVNQHVWLFTFICLCIFSEIILVPDKKKKTPKDAVNLSTTEGGFVKVILFFSLC